MKKIGTIIITFILVVCVNGCGLLEGTVNELRGDISGNTYTIDSFDNFGQKTMTCHGQKINVIGNVVKERSYSSGESGYVETLSSVITINIDGKQIHSSGETMIFYEDGLKPDVDFRIEKIQSEAKGIWDSTIITGIVNKYKNMFGKPVVVVIKSQMGAPIYAFSGNNVYWTVPDNLPKFTKLTVDGKQLYVHRANFQIIDRELIDE